MLKEGGSDPTHFLGRLRVFIQFELSLSEKQIPRVVVNVSS
jgi:hypothetical protein